MIILKANGSVFCAGHDRPEILNQPVTNIHRLFQISFNLMTAIRNVPQCVIAEVHAIAMAGGRHLVAGSTLITAAREKAQFGMKTIFIVGLSSGDLPRQRATYIATERPSI